MFDFVLCNKFVDDSNIDMYGLIVVNLKFRQL